MGFNSGFKGLTTAFVCMFVVGRWHTQINQLYGNRTHGFNNVPPSLQPSSHPHTPFSWDQFTLPCHILRKRKLPVE